MKDIPESWIDIFESDRRFDAVYALGSVVRHELRESSDIDIALLPAFHVKPEPHDLLELAGRLTDIAGRPVDLGVLSTRNLVYARQAILTGKRVWRRAGTAADMRIATLLGLYARFQFDRREVLNAYTTG